MPYFIGKYEAIACQYAAVMSRAATFSGQGEASVYSVPDGMATRLSKIDLSRFDTKRLDAMYSAWLPKNHPELLSVSGCDKNPEDGGTGLVCPPTGVEWEFAARDGQVVSRQELEGRLSPRKIESSDQGGPLGDWAVYN